ncbi:ComF family protein [Armatimonas rosea]|uniref:ComF family protein n=1 Tax=Armatimonas rosea TaxID=685828 RepID=A0A7W9STX8_ARMRO|nr:ComF family protein [Armatimonas rosea]MBB6052766.1 ComF family protein [Armatimonas rosea]
MRALAGFLDLIYPPRCLLCESWEEPVLCSACVAQLPTVPEPVCVVCGHPSEPERVCRLCEAAADRWGGWAFESARAAGRHVGALRYGLHLLKYRGKESLAEPLGAWLAHRYLTELRGTAPPELLVALPLSARKRRARGYNQAALLAQPLAEQLALPVLPEGAFVRVRAEQSQMTLGAAQRLANLSPTDFEVTDPALLAGKRLLLIDDVMTTGASLHCAAATLLKAGAAGVEALALSRSF